MNLIKSLLCAALPLTSALLCRGAGVDTRQATFDPSFRTLTVTAADDLMAPPVIRLNSNDRIVVSFDEIGDDYSFLQYRLVHCNADWQPSALVESEYLDSFNVSDIDDYAFSSNTFVHFVNYRFEIPSEGMVPLVSGNYLVQVYRQEDPDNVLLQVRFSVSEGALAVTGNASGRTDRGFNTEWQQLALRLTSGSQKIQNPYQDLIVNITQNGRPETTRRLTHPSRVEGNSVIFEHSPELIYPAGNEFRRFETVRITDPGMHVDSIRFGGSNYHVYLSPDEGRADRSYSYDQTQRGRFMVRESNATDSDLGADYVTVNFTLDFPEIMDADIYVDGALTDWRLSSSNRMRRDPSTGLYTLALPLKQGSYNYQYVVAPRGASGGAFPTVIEGNHYETRNEYLVEVFYRPVGSRADRLLGYGVILSE